MQQYKVRSGQNIYDVALTLHGSVEGIFDLLASNGWLTMETTLSYGMALNYHEEFIVNKAVALWLKENRIIVRNGEHVYDKPDIEVFIKEYLQKEQNDKYIEVGKMSPDEQNMYWGRLCKPRMIIHHQGQLSTIYMQLKPNKHLFIDWGDYSEPKIVNDTVEQEIEHWYKGPGPHIITFYGDFDFSFLNLNEANGIHYALDIIIADLFESELNNENLNKLIITK